MTKLISDAARDLIVAEEVSSKETYIARYQRPEWPGGASGVTIGIGYDVGAGVSSRAQLRADWSARIPESMIRALEPCIGVTGEAAHRMLASVREKVSVPWGTAIDVFDSVDVPRWYATCVKHLPNFELLPLDCKGVLLSLAYNRGPSFAMAGDRYREMRAIKAHMIARDYGQIPAQLRSMRRLWTNASNRGVSLRREHEARLFERGLSAPLISPLPPPVIAQPVRPIPIPAPVAVTPRPAPPPAPVVQTGWAALFSSIAAFFKPRV